MAFKNKFILAALLFSPFTVMAAEFSLGMGAAYNESPYKGYNDTLSAVPLVSYEDHHFYVRQASLGWIIWKDEKNELSLTASWMPLHFDPDDNDDAHMRQLDKRRASAMLGGAFYRHERWGSLKLTLAADAGDESGGVMGELAYFKPVRMARFTLTPSAGVYYYDESLNDKYYGVSASESRRSGLQQYAAGDSWMPYVGLSAQYALTSQLLLNASARYAALPDAVRKSPMIDRDDSVTLMIGLAWRF